MLSDASLQYGENIFLSWKMECSNQWGEGELNGAYIISSFNKSKYYLQCLNAKHSLIVSSNAQVVFVWRIDYEELSGQSFSRIQRALRTAVLACNRLRDGNICSEWNQNAWFIVMNIHEGNAMVWLLNAAWLAVHQLNDKDLLVCYVIMYCLCTAPIMVHFWSKIIQAQDVQLGAEM